MREANIKAGQLLRNVTIFVATPVCTLTEAFESAVNFFRELNGHPVVVQPPKKKKKRLVLNGAVTFGNMYNENSSGSSPEPCGTPQLTWKDSCEGVQTGIYSIIKS